MGFRVRDGHFTEMVGHIKLSGEIEIKRGSIDCIKPKAVADVLKVDKDKRAIGLANNVSFLEVVVAETDVLRDRLKRKLPSSQFHVQLCL